VRCYLTRTCARRWPKRCNCCNVHHCEGASSAPSTWAPASKTVCGSTPAPSALGSGGRVFSAHEWALILDRFCIFHLVASALHRRPTGHLVARWPEQTWPQTSPSSGGALTSQSEPSACSSLASALPRCCLGLAPSSQADELAADELPSRRQASGETGAPIGLPLVKCDWPAAQLLRQLCLRSCISKLGINLLFTCAILLPPQMRRHTRVRCQV